MERGLIIGKFSVIHKGHLEVIRTALKYVKRENLYVFVCSKKNDFISGADRVCVFSRIFINVKFILVEEEIEEAAKTYESAYVIWGDYIKDKLKTMGIDSVKYVFGSEDYTIKLAQYLNAKSVLVDVNRIKFPISASKIMENPLKYKWFMPKEMWNFFCQIQLVNSFKKINNDTDSLIINIKKTPKTKFASWIRKEQTRAFGKGFRKLILKLNKD